MMPIVLLPPEHAPTETIRQNWLEYSPSLFPARHAFLDTLSESTGLVANPPWIEPPHVAL
ncbi:hypothetical protein Pla52o_49540 [Novipirellula galeiformis]|uniref:Uncharacterized protein n=1 Tax=Novipirellula galeiformis TaxID=2528004 RepID=A0A5C6C4K9_9BACT|nr:hypothetical protein Pla52o_49540 [Novipirellula galeiformis]